MTNNAPLSTVHPRRRKVNASFLAYCVFATFTFLFLIVFGVLDLLHSPTVSRTIQHLGYPRYFSYLLGAGKLLAAAALAYPKTRVLREWAYAGVFFELISSFLSHSFVGDAWPQRLAPLFVLAIVAVTRWYDPRRVLWHRSRPTLD